MRAVEFDLEAQPEHIDVRGNCMVSGDADFDRECEDKIIDDLEDGNVWAWASVRVSASVSIDDGVDYLGCCSYKSEEDFLGGAYYLDMKSEALSALRSELEESLKAVVCAENDLTAERAAFDKRQALIELWRCPLCKEVVAIDPGYDDTPFCADCDTDRDPFDPVDVIFLRDPDDGDVFAVFPGCASTIGNPNHMTCYSHIGGHSGVDLAYCAECNEVFVYADLASELKRIGYNLYVISKYRMKDSKYTDARLEQLRM